MTSPALDLLANNSYPELAVAVRAVLAETIAAWDCATRQALPSVNDLTKEQLRDDFPLVLQHVANALEATTPPAADHLSAAAPRHGEVRFDQGFNLNQVMIEYSILRSTLIEEVGAHLQRDLHVDEVLGLSAALDVTLRQAVVRFVDNLSGQLQAASEAQSKYLSFLSHDLRGGLNGVFLMIEVLKRELVGETRLAETVADLDVMRRSLLETISTMDRFLHAERFRKGKVQVRPTTVVLRNAILETAAHFSYQAREKRVELRIEVPIELSIVSDKELLTMIFQNLLSNALKYTHAGTAVVINGHCNDDDTCTITVADKGPGIKPEMLKDLFTAFARGETHGQPGVGLGLTIARQAAQYLNAKLWAESVPGDGATFLVELPRKLPS